MGEKNIVMVDLARSRRERAVRAERTGGEGVGQAAMVGETGGLGLARRPSAMPSIPGRRGLGT